MKPTRDDSWWALLASAALLSLTYIPRSTSEAPAPSASARIPPSPVRDAVASQERLPSPVWRSRTTGSRNPGATHRHTTNLIETVRHSSDGPANQILSLIETNLPPGWEQTFLLHDALATAGALTDMARVISFASSVDLEFEPRLALTGDALVLQQIADNVARTWLATKYPMLGTNVIESILHLPSRDVLPMLGDYNLVPATEAIRILEVPSAGTRH